MLEKIKSTVSEINAFAESKGLGSRLLFKEDSCTLGICTIDGYKEGIIYSTLSYRDVTTAYSIVNSLKTFVFFSDMVGDI